MPIYTYICKKCSSHFEHIEGVIAEPGDIKCPECGSKDADKCFSSFNVAKSSGSQAAPTCPTCPTCPGGGTCGI